MRFLLVVILLLGQSIASMAVAESPCARVKSLAAESRPIQPIWKWTVAERLAQRLDPDLIVYRQCQEEAAYRAAGTQRPPSRPQDAHHHSIDGSRDPELLLPHELFMSLMTGFMPDEERRRRYRESLRGGIQRAGFDDESFWTELRSATSDYIDHYRYPRTEADRGRDPCHARFLALENARQAFGRDRFDRLLYEVIAPQTQVASGGTASDPARQLTYFETGCQ